MTSSRPAKFCVWSRNQNSVCLNPVSLQRIVHLPKLLCESAHEDKSSGWTKLYHERLVISSAEYPKK